MNVIINADILKNILKSLHVLVEEARFRFNEEGMSVKAVDPANIALVIVNVPKESFEVYRIDSDEVGAKRKDEVIGVDVGRVYDFIKSVKNDELIDMTVRDDKLVLRNRAVEYSVALINPESIRKEPKIPDLKLPAKIVIDAGDFKRAIQICEKIDDVLTFVSSEDRFSIEAEGDIEKITFSLSENEIEFNRAEAKSMFSTEYMKEIAKIAQRGDLMTIKLGNNHPARFKFDNFDRAYVEYFVAPRIET